jgi:hypothetical protein
MDGAGLGVQAGDRTDAFTQVLVSEADRVAKLERRSSPLGVMTVLRLRRLR